MRNEIRNELKEIAVSLADIGNANCYRVPENYFEDFASEVMSKIQLPFTQMPFTPPAPAYFEGLAGAIMDKIKSNGTIVEANSEVDKELMAISPLVAGIKKVNVYTAPPHYFANFKVAIPAARKATVVAMRPAVRWMRYAVAAAVVGAVAISGMFLFKNDSITNSDARVTYTKDYTAPLSSVSDNAIASYLKNSPAEMDITPSVYDDSKINAGSLAEQLLQDVSDSDIQEYLQENQQPGEKDIKGI